jgi:winged helix DNA-binding protein
MSPSSKTGIADRRLANQLIGGPAPLGPGDVVRALVALQAQDYLGSLWAVGLRHPSAVEADVERALADRTLVRTWPLRGTLHLVAAADVRWLLGLLTPRVMATSAGRHRQLELDAAVFDRSRKVFIRALQGGRQVSRTRLYELLAAAGITPAGSRGLHILGRLAHEGLICFGPRDGKQQTFVLLDEWVPPARSKSREEALAELAARYFRSRGPATLGDFAWWSGLAVKDARAGVGMAQDRLLEERVAGRTYWSGAGASSSPDDRAAAHLLPPFDEYTVAYRDRSDVLDSANRKAVNAGGGMLNPVIVLGGRVVGTWKRQLTKHEVHLTLSPFRSLNRRERRAVEAAADRYGRFLGLAARVA